MAKGNDEPKVSEAGHEGVQQTLPIDAFAETPPERSRPGQKAGCGDTESHAPPGRNGSFQIGVGDDHATPYTTRMVR